MAHLDYYFTVLSPYAYLAGLRMEAIANRHGLTVTYKPLDIMALFPRTGGAPLPERHPSRIAYRAQELPRQARKLGMPLTFKPAHFPTNAAPASYAIIAAQKAGGGDMAGLVHGLLRAVWAEEKDVAEDSVVQECLSAAGFDPSLTFSGMLTGAEVYSANLEDAVNGGVFGSPFYVLDDGEKFWGQDRLEDLDLHLSGKL